MRSRFNLFFKSVYGNCSLVPCFMASERLLKAVEAVKLSYRQAAEKFNCPKTRSSIYDHYFEVL